MKLKHYILQSLIFTSPIDPFSIDWIKGLPGLFTGKTETSFRLSGGKSNSGHHHPFSCRTAFPLWLVPPRCWVFLDNIPTVLDRITQGWSNRALRPLCRCAGWRETHGRTHVHEFGVVDQFSSKRFLSNFGFLLRINSNTVYFQSPGSSDIFATKCQVPGKTRSKAKTTVPCPAIVWLLGMTLEKLLT